MLDHIRKYFLQVETYPISWKKEHFADNLSRFYGTKLPSKKGKAKHCGEGEFLLVTFVDPAPIYDFVETSRGSERVNSNLFSMKELFREWTGGGHKIHATNSPEETDHDLALLLGINYADYMARLKQKKPTPITPPHSIIGLQGWKSLEQLFATMNSCLPYALLRNFEVLPNAYYANDHGDIDFLVEDLEKAVLITGATKVHNEPERVHYTIKVKGELTANFDSFKSPGIVSLVRCELKP